MSAFRDRKPWATALIALPGPTVSMLYLGRGRLAICYYLLSVLAATAGMFAVHYLSLNLTFVTAMWTGFITVHLFGFLHSLIIARRLDGRRPSAWFSRWYCVIVLAVLLPLAISSTTRWFLWEPFDLPSGSMKPALQVGDMVFVSKYAYGYSPRTLPFSLGLFPLPSFGNEPARGDIVVFKSPRDNRTDYIKRIIGLPGDRIQVLGGILHINDQAVARREVTNAPEDEDVDFRGQKLQRYIEELPGGVSYPILEASDNGFLDNTRPYEIPEGHYFAMGDNRDNSRDSRTTGFIPRENLVGRLSLILSNGKERQVELLN